jgi:hypothetical protein
MEAETGEVTQVSTPMEIGAHVEAEQGDSPTPETEATEVAPPETTAEETTESATPESLEIQEQAQNVLQQAGIDMTALTSEYNENGVLAEESLASLEAAGFPRDLVDNYIAGAKAVNAQAEQMVQRAAYDVVGGVENYAAVVAWAGTNLSPAATEAFNAAVTSGDEGQISLAVAGLNAQYVAQVGNEGTQVQGSAAPAAPMSDVFENKAAMLAALSDPKYRASPAHRASIDTKVSRSMKAHGGSIPR